MLMSESRKFVIQFSAISFKPMRLKTLFNGVTRTVSNFFFSTFPAIELPHDLVGQILEKLPVKSLLKFKSVSKNWKSTIESCYFKERQLLYSQHSRDPDVILINPIEWYTSHGRREKEENVIRMLTLNSLDVVKLPNFCPPRQTIWLDNVGDIFSFNFVCGSIDGLICYYNYLNCIHVVNPTTRWSRSIPHARFHATVVDMYRQDSWKGDNFISLWELGFGKDNFTNTYKLVWLYNSFELGLENITTCEVFDFSTNIWRYVTAAPCRILDKKTPLYLDGSLHWFTDEYVVETTRILAFDLHTEKFQMISKAPFIQATCKQIIMCNLNDHLCVSQKLWPRQEIWSLEKSNMTWEKIYSLNLPSDSHWFKPEDLPHIIPCVIPVMVMKNKKTLMLFDARAKEPSLVIYDPELETYDLCFALDYHSCLFATALSHIESLKTV